MPSDLDVLLADAAEVIPEDELREKLARGTPLRVKLGLDPTAPAVLHELGDLIGVDLTQPVEHR